MGSNTLPGIEYKYMYFAEKKIFAVEKAKVIKYKHFTQCFNCNHGSSYDSSSKI